MKIRMIGCSHHQAPLQVREQLAFSDSERDQALKELREAFPEADSVLLNTCNRVEIYVTADAQSELPDQEWLLGYLSRFHQIPLSQLAPHMKTAEDHEAVLHLFSVASSLDSVVVGETQIQAQVQDAYQNAQQHFRAGPRTHALFQHASYAAKRVANETEIHRRRISVPSVAVSEIAGEFFERLDDKEILVIGSGTMGEETLRYLVDAGARSIVIVNRTYENAQLLAQKYQAQAGNWEQLNTYLGAADLVVSTTGASQPIVTLNQFRQLLKTRKKAAILILDLAVPRDFEEAIGQLSEVYLYTIDDIQRVCARNLEWREQQWPQAKRILQEETERFWKGMKHRSAIPTIQAFRDHAVAIKEAEWFRLKGRLANHQLPVEIEQEIEQTLDRMMNKLLHPPLKSLREEDRSEDRASLLRALQRLFQLKD